MNISFSEVVIEEVALHLVGNKSREEGFKAGKESLKFENEDDKYSLMDYFLSSFKLDEFYRFNHDTSLDMNEVYTYCGYIFSNIDDFHPQSVNILSHLYEKSGHPNIQGGELYVAFFRNILLEDELVDAIGIFKSERKDKFLKLDTNGEDFKITFDSGTNTDKLDKGCLILNTYGDEGYRVLCVDMKSAEARYWKDEFLMVTQLQDGAFHTKTFLTLCKDYCQEVYAKETDRKEQVNFLNKSMEYFKKKEEFDYNEFKEEVFEEPAKAENFDNYARTYRDDFTPETNADKFFISPPAVKKMKAKLKNLIKLDTQIEIKLNATAEASDEFVERGFDNDKKMYFYKIFFNQES